MALLTVQPILQAGSGATFASAAGGGDTFVAKEGVPTFFEAVNGSGGSINVTIAAVQTQVKIPSGGYAPISNLVVAVPAGARRSIPILPYMLAADGTVTVTYSGVTSLTVAAQSLGPF